MRYRFHNPVAARGARVAFAAGACAAIVAACAGGGPFADVALGDAPQWRLEQPPTPDGSPPGPLGAPGALRFVAPNRGLLQTGGSGGNPAGLWTYDGQSWRLLANVCGAGVAGEYGAVAFAAHDEFWTVSDPAPNPFTTPSPPLWDSSPDSGTTLCHFQGGRVVASYAVDPTASGAYLSMQAATCLNPDDCWFGGVAGKSSDGAHAGTFHLHWNGSTLAGVWSGQDRAVSSLTSFQGTVFQTSVLGERPFDNRAARPATPDAGINAPLVQVLSSGQFVDDPYRTPPGAAGSYGPPTLGQDAPPDSNLQEVDVLDSQASLDGSELWISGGGAESGETWGDNSGNYGAQWATHDPFLAVKLGGGPLVPLRFSDSDRLRWLGSLNQAGGPYGTQTFASVAPIPASNHEAWVAVIHRHFPAGFFSEVDTRYKADDARLVRVRFDPNAPAGQPNATVLEDVSPPDGAGRGQVRRVACPAANSCWAVTTSGWLLHWSDGSPQPVDSDPAYGQLISLRPPDGRSPQPVPTGDPFDDSNLYKPLPAIVIVPPPPPPTPKPRKQVRRVGPLIGRVSDAAAGQRGIELHFELARPARVGLEGLLHGRVVARTRAAALVPGDQRLFLAARPGWWPQQIRFTIQELARLAPTLETAARRSSARVLALTVRAPADGLVALRVSVDGTAHGGGGTSRTVRVRSRGAALATVALPAELAAQPLVVAFRFTARGAGVAGVPRSLAAQRLVAAPARQSAARVHFRRTSLGAQQPR